MPIHFEDSDIAPEIHGIESALIVPCIMCPAATVAIREQKPFLNVLRSPFKSAPLEGYIESLRSRLEGEGVQTEVFESRLHHHWFMCMWTGRRREKLLERSRRHDAVIVLGCESATETVREAVKTTDCKVIEAMKVSGIMNAHLRFRLPGSVTFENCRIVPISEHSQGERAARRH